jgi:hypothetical protein
MMKTLAGLWIDHREAVIVLVSGKGRETKRIKSNVEEQVESQIVPADNSRERSYGGHLAGYYDQVISFLRPAEAIMLFGPGEAKGELRTRIEQNQLDLRIIRFETSDKMTEHQVSREVRRHYSPQNSTVLQRRRIKS